MSFYHGKTAQYTLFFRQKIFVFLFLQNIFAVTYLHRQDDVVTKITNSYKTTVQAFSLYRISFEIIKNMHSANMTHQS